VGGVANLDITRARKASGLVLGTVHNLVIQVMEHQNEYFKLGLHAEVKERADDFQECWKGQPWAKICRACCNPRGAVFDSVQ
jgi:hypothetical protein